MSAPALYERFQVERDFLSASLKELEEVFLGWARTIDANAFVTGRVKTLRSIVGKAYRKDPMGRRWETFGDLVALKAIFPTQRGVDEFTKLINSKADYLPKLDPKDVKPHELKYQSMQFDLTSPNHFDSEGANLKFELQVRSAAVDAWYVVDHRLKYKGIIDLPERLQRQLNRLIVLTELFDQEVESVISHQEQLPEYTLESLYRFLTDSMDSLLESPGKAERTEGLFELILSSYRPEEVETLAACMDLFLDEQRLHVEGVLRQHFPGAVDYVERFDWVYSEPEALLIAERAITAPALLASKVRNTDFESVVMSMIANFKQK